MSSSERQLRDLAIRKPQTKLSDHPEDLEMFLVNPHQYQMQRWRRAMIRPWSRTRLSQNRPPSGERKLDRDLVCVLYAQFKVFS
jgi:hypothetical protein